MTLQPFDDLDQFLSGIRAPALVAHSLASVVSQDPAAVAKAVVRWAYGQIGRDRFAALLAARNKVFDIFFYRIVPFDRVYGFFDRFETELAASVPPTDRPRVEILFEEHPWREIRPLGKLKAMEEFALEHRREAVVSAEAFNDEVYQNTTHEILSVERRYEFADEATQERVGHYQAQVGQVFNRFVDLIKDSARKRDILIANTADRDAEYTHKQRFQLDHYVCQLADFAIALLNDDFLEHGVRVFETIGLLASENALDLHSLPRFQEKTAFVNLQKLGEYSATKTGAVLLRDVLPIFEKWNAERMLNALLVESDRRERKLLLSLIETYGGDAYRLVVETLEDCDSTTPWYFVRNLAYLLGRIVTRDERLKSRAIARLEPYLRPDRERQLNVHVAAALGFLGTDEATGVLVAKLAVFGKQFDDNREAQDICHKIVSTLIGVETSKALDAALDFCLEYNLLRQYSDAFGRVRLPASIRAKIVSRVRAELRKMRITFSLIDTSSASLELIGALGSAGYPEVEDLCEDILRVHSFKPALVAACRRLRATEPPPERLARDRVLHRLLAQRDIPQVCCHALDAGTTGFLDVVTREEKACQVELRKGDVVNARALAYGIESENAFYWTFLLEGRDLSSVRFTPIAHPSAERSIATGSAALLRDALFQRGEVQQIIGGAISPDSRFRQRPVHPFYTQFEHLDEPRKYEMVWESLADEVDIRAIQSITELNRHDIYRILLYFLRRNMLAVDGGEQTERIASIEDALTTIERYVRRLSALPIQFQSCRAAADVCSYLESHAADATIASAAQALRRFFRDAFLQHRILMREDIEIAVKTLELTRQYCRTGTGVERQELSDYIDFYFAALRSTGNLPPISTVPSDSLLERIENIEAANDPFDELGNALSEDAIDALLDSIDALVTTGGARQIEAGKPEHALTEYEEQALLDLFSNIAGGYVKPFKDFVRELDRNHRANRTTSSSWLEFVHPSVQLLSNAARKMGYEKLLAIVARVDELIVEQRSVDERGTLPLLFCERVLVEHHRLAHLMPTTFALTASEDELTGRKEGLIVKFILNQVAGVTDRVFNKLVLAGLNSFNRFVEVNPQDIALVAGIDRRLAERIYMKFYQYQDIYYRHLEPVKHAKFAAMFEVGLNILREIHLAVEQIALDERAGVSGDETRKQALISDRQRTLWSLFTLLCIKDKHDLIERLQMTVFEERIRLLDAYYTELVGDHGDDAPKAS